LGYGGNGGGGENKTQTFNNAVKIKNKQTESECLVGEGDNGLDLGSDLLAKMENREDGNHQIETDLER
jgi:hypothetical protein